MHTVGICLKHFVCVCLPFCSISATMLTCRTPPQPSPSQHKVQLHIDGVIREAPVSYTYNENPHISSVQPKHSFIRSALQPTFSYLTCAWSWGSTGRVLKYAFNSKFFCFVHVCPQWRKHSDSEWFLPPLSSPTSDGSHCRHRGQTLPSGECTQPTQSAE